MVPGYFTAQTLIVVVLGIAAFAFEVFALIDALRHRPDAYTAAGKQTKQFWTIVLVIAALVGFSTIFGVLTSFIGLIAIVAAGVYMADVRPALQAVTGRGGRQGPYGPW